MGAGIILIGAAYGISRLAAAALDGIARQPEAGGTLQLSMIIAAALIEGLAFFALIQTNNATNKSPQTLEAQKYADEHGAGH